MSNVTLIMQYPSDMYMTGVAQLTMYHIICMDNLMFISQTL